MKHLHVTFQLILLVIPELVKAYKILLFAPGISNSQMMFNYRLGELLASAGHNVTIFRAQYNEAANKGKVERANEIVFEVKKIW